MDGQQAPELEVLDHRELLQALRKEGKTREVRPVVPLTSPGTQTHMRFLTAATSVGIHQCSRAPSQSSPWPRRKVVFFTFTSSPPPIQRHSYTVEAKTGSWETPIDPEGKRALRNGKEPKHNPQPKPDPSGIGTSDDNCEEVRDYFL